MIERRRLLGGAAEVHVVQRRDDCVWYMIGDGIRRTMLPGDFEALTEPIPEEEITGNNILDQREWSGFMEEPQPDPLADLLARVEALGKEVARAHRRITAEAKLQVAAEQVEGERIEWIRKLEKRIEALEQPKYLTAHEFWDPNPAPAAADGPSAEEVVAYMEGVHQRCTRKDCEVCRMAAHAARLIRAGQEDTRPVLTEEMAARAYDKYYENIPGNGHTAMARALLATGAFREAPDAP